MWILDASVVVKWFFTDEKLREKAIEIQDAVAEVPLKFVVPHLFYSELTHVLARKSGLSTQFVRDALNLVLNLGLRTVSLTSEGFADLATFSCQGFSGYDATYLGLAKQLGARWITADFKAIKKAPADLTLELASWKDLK